MIKDGKRIIVDQGKHPEGCDLFNNRDKKKYCITLTQNGKYKPWFLIGGKSDLGWAKIMLDGYWQGMKRKQYYNGCPNGYSVING